MRETRCAAGGREAISGGSVVFLFFSRGGTGYDIHAPPLGVGVVHLNKVRIISYMCEARRNSPLLAQAYQYSRPRRVREAHCAAGGAEKGRQVAGTGFAKMGEGGQAAPYECRDIRFPCRSLHLCGARTKSTVPHRWGEISFLAWHS